MWSVCHTSGYNTWAEGSRTYGIIKSIDLYFYISGLDRLLSGSFYQVLELEPNAEILNYSSKPKLKRTNIYYLTQFPRVRNLGAA